MNWFDIYESTRKLGCKMGDRLGLDWHEWIPHPHEKYEFCRWCPAKRPLTLVENEELEPV